MFGYVKPYSPELLVKDYEFYKATYCGVCRAMKRHTGALSNVALSYDSVFLALLRMLFVPDSDIDAVRGRCIAHPLKSRPMLKENAALEYTARAFAVLTYYKLLDDMSDEAAIKKIGVSLAKTIFKGATKRAHIPDVNEIIKEKLDKITEHEVKRTRSVDEPAALFGELLGELFSHGLTGADRLVCYELGLHLGKFIFCADAAEDYDEDIRQGKYNPYALLYDSQPLSKENKQSIKCALLLECKEMENAVNLLPFGTRYTIENIIKNVIYRGLVKRIEFLDEAPLLDGGKEKK